MKLEKLLIYGGILYLVYELFLKNVPQLKHFADPLSFSETGSLPPQLGHGCLYFTKDIIHPLEFEPYH